MIKEKIYFLLIVLASFGLPSYSQVEIEASELVDSVLLNDSLALFYSEKGDLKKAQEYAFNNVIINSSLGKYSVPYAIAVLKYARYLYPNERETDDELSNEGLAILKDSLGLISSTYTKYLLEYAWRQFNSNQILEACNTLKEIVEANYNDDEFFRGYIYYSYAHFLGKTDEKELAEKYAIKAKSVFEYLQQYEDEYYLKTLTELALLNISNQEMSINYLNKVKTAIEKNNGKNNIDYLDVLLNIAYVYRYNNKLEDALDYAKQAKETGELIKQIDYGSYLYTLEFLAKQYSSLKQYNDAIKYSEECLNLMKETKDFGLEDRLPTLDSLVTYYWHIENYEKCNLYAKEAYMIRKNVNIVGRDIVNTIEYLLHSNYSLGRYSDCVENVSELRSIYGDKFAYDFDHYFHDILLLSDCYYILHKHEDALLTIQEFCTKYKEIYGQDTELYASTIKKLAISYYNVGNKDNYLKLTDTSLWRIKYQIP